MSIRLQGPLVTLRNSCARCHLVSGPSISLVCVLRLHVFGAWYNVGGAIGISLFRYVAAQKSNNRRGTTFYERI